MNKEEKEKIIMTFGYAPDEHTEIYDNEEEAFKDIETYGIPKRMFKGYEAKLTLTNKKKEKEDEHK